jgi:hypothetical protein
MDNVTILDFKKVQFSRIDEMVQSIKSAGYSCVVYVEDDLNMLNRIRSALKKSDRVLLIDIIGKARSQFLDFPYVSVGRYASVDEVFQSLK